MNLRELWRTMRTTYIYIHLLVLLAISCFIHGSPTNLSILPGVELTTFGLTGRIVNGTRAALTQFPHQVSLMRSWSRAHFCGANLISASLVLTAGHCMYLSGNVIEPWMILVVGGIVRLYDQTPTRQEEGVMEIRLHPKFDLDNLYNDVAVLKLSKAFTFTPELHSVPLPGKAPVPNTFCQVSGWGYPSSDIPIISPVLMYVDLPVRSVEECRKLLENVTVLPSGMFCAGYLEGGRDACQGDSGGGMVCNGILTGVVSGGNGCAQPLLPGVYADVFYYLNWILDNSDAVVIVQKPSSTNVVPNHFGTNAGRSYGAHKTIMIVMISFLFCAVINYT